MSGSRSIISRGLGAKVLVAIAMLIGSAFVLGQPVGALSGDWSVSGEGTCFGVTNSTYLNVTLCSNEVVNVTLESIPRVVSFTIEAVNEGSSTNISLSGFEPGKTYYRYQDGYLMESFATDENGSYSYAQDLSGPHHVFMQEERGTKYIGYPGGKDCTLIGTWDALTRTCTLTMNVTEMIVLDGYGITLDGHGWSVSGSFQYGVYTSGQRGIVVKDVVVNGPSYGIYLYNFESSKVTGNTVSATGVGIYLYGSRYTTGTVTGNNVSGSSSYGIYLSYSDYGEVSGNTASGGQAGIYLYASDSSKVSGNTASGGQYGIHVYYYSDKNTLTGNYISGNPSSGIFVDYANGNSVIGNNISGNPSSGIRLSYADTNMVSGNEISGGSLVHGIIMYRSSGNTLTYNGMTRGGITIEGELPDWDTHTIDATNTVGGKPVQYRKDASGETIPAGAGQVILADCTNMIVENQVVRNVDRGIAVAFGSGNTIRGNEVSGSYYGIYLDNPGGITVSDNTVSVSGRDSREGSTPYGIMLSSATSAAVTGNTVSVSGSSYLGGASNGIVLRSTTSSTVSENAVTVSSDISVQTSFTYGIELASATGSTLSKNTVSVSGSLSDLGSHTYGIMLSNSAGSVVSENTVSVSGSDSRGINLYRSGSTVSGNLILGGGSVHGIYLDESSGVTLTGNAMTQGGITIGGSALPYWNTHTIDATNTVAGKPVQYLKDASGATVPAGAGQVILAGCSNTIVENQVVNGGYRGITVAFGSANKILGNTVSGGSYAIYVGDSAGGTISGNTVGGITAGIYLSYSSSTVSTNTISSRYGVYLYYSSGSTLSGNNVSADDIGIYTYVSGSNSITGNVISGTDLIHGIYLQGSQGNTLSNNQMTRGGVTIEGYNLADWTSQAIGTTNTVGGKPVQYRKGPACGTIPAGAGQVILASCTNTVVENEVINDVYSGITAAFGTGNTIKGNTISGGSYGIHFYETSGTVIGNKVSSGKTAIHLEDSVGTLSGNKLSVSGEDTRGIHLYRSGSSAVSGNSISASGESSRAIYLQDSGSCTVSGNTMYNSGTASMGVYWSYSTASTVSGNAIAASGNYAYGIYQYYSGSSTVTGNIITGGAFGIYSLNAGSSTMSENTISGNANGFTFRYSSNNVLFHNNIIGNKEQLYNEVSTNTWNNPAKEGNYWSDYAGLDDGSGGRTANDGIGDTNLPHQGVDSHPLMHPFPNTPIGKDVVISAGYGVKLHFTEVLSPGFTLASQVSGSPPSNHRLIPDHTLYEITSTADFAGTVGLSIAYDPTGLTPADEQKLKLMCYDETNGVWIDITTSLDIENKMIQGVTVQLGTFGVTLIFEPPTVSIGGPASGSLFAVGEQVALLGHFTDPNTEETHIAQWTFTSMALSIMMPGAVTESGGSGEVKDVCVFNNPGIYSITLTVTNTAGATGVATDTFEGLPAFIVVYDPEGAFVTGGGWIYSQNGAYLRDKNVDGKASFGFIAKYQKGAKAPSGQTEFHLQVADLDFHSTSYDVLIIVGGRAQFKGLGVLKVSQGSKFREMQVRFTVTAFDGDIRGGDGIDRFRMQIWSIDASDELIYDNMQGAPDDAMPPPIGGGSIVFHKK